MTNAATVARYGYATGRDANELREFFLGNEARVGFRSTFGAMLAALEGVPMGGSNGDHDPHAERIDRERGTSSGTRVWRALRNLDHMGDVQSIITLHRLYGAVRVPVGYLPAFGDPDVAQIASLTDAAEDVREQLAFTRGSERESGVRLRCITSKAESLDALAEDFWRAVRSEAKATAAGRTDMATAWREVQARALNLCGDGRDGTLSATISTYAGCDRETTTDDAIGHALADNNPVRRSSFISQVKRDAAGLKARSLAAYASVRGR